MREVFFEGKEKNEADSKFPSDGWRYNFTAKLEDGDDGQEIPFHIIGLSSEIHVDCEITAANTFVLFGLALLESQDFIRKVVVEELANKKVNEFLDELKVSKETKNIVVEVEGGIVTDVKYVPEGYTYEVRDNDIRGVCSICHKTVPKWEWPKHLASHNEKVGKRLVRHMDAEETGEYFIEVI
jgi:hypothetical protein